ncbi:MAG TPA: hypothetical protein VKN18_10920 [Blastocatellia bacterium]|nr:hypothetical protein [Blastocatellia bacterium]
MKKRIQSLLTASALLLVSVIATAAQQEHQHQHDTQRPADQHQHDTMDMSAMMKEPHHVLAMAYLQNLATFGKALRDNVDSTKSVDGDFARAAVSEMRRSFDSMQQHVADHMKSMPADMQSHMNMMMQGMNAHTSAINQSLTALEREIQAETPSATKVSASAAEIVKHIDEMGKSHGDHKM